MNDDDKMTLRDKFAIEILNALLGREHQTASIDFVNYFDDEIAKDRTSKKMERLIRAVYQIADLMRKVRLTTFQ